MRSWKIIAAFIAVLGLCLFGVATAFADAPDFDMASNPAITAQIGQDGTVTVSVTGQWKWTSRSRNCNNDKRAVGVAIDWNDPADPGNPVGTVGGVSFDVGTATDNVVHPATSVGLPNGTSKVDIASPTQYADWRGGCGTYGYDPVLRKSYNSGSYGPLIHQYKPIIGQTQNVIKLCAVLYDVPLTSVSGAPSRASSVTAGGSSNNGDNSVVKNPGTAVGSNCKEVSVSEPEPGCGSSFVTTPTWQQLPRCGSVTPGQFQLTPASSTTVTAQANLANGEYIGLACLNFTFRYDLLDPGEGFKMFFLDFSTGPTITNNSPQPISELQWCFPPPFASFRAHLNALGWYPNGWPMKINITSTGSSTMRVNMWLEYSTS